MSRLRTASSTAVQATKRKRVEKVKIESSEENEIEIKRKSSRPAIKTETAIELNNEVTGVLSDIKIEIKQEPADIADKKSDLKYIPHIKVEIEKDTPPNIFPYIEKQHHDLPKAPKNWYKIYNEIVTMRSKISTPVDTQGCERMPNSINPNVRTRNPRIYRFQLLISLMLSSQTKDEVNYLAMKTMHEGLLANGYKDGLCIEALLELTEKELDDYICKVGFHNRKAGYIKRACEMLRDNFQSDIPSTIEDVVTLPGVGPKMGYLLLQNAWGINSGIGVDVHLHRLAQMWSWTSKNAKTPEHTRVELEDWLPPKYWADINPLLVGFGQTICVPRAPNCDICTLATTGLCKASKKSLLKTPITDERLKKLNKQRGDLSKLIAEFV